MSLLRLEVAGAAGVDERWQGQVAQDQDFWFGWPSRESLSRIGLTPVRRRISQFGRWAGLGAALWADFASFRLHPWQSAAVLGGAALAAAAFWTFIRFAARRRRWAALAALAVVLGVALALPIVHGRIVGGLLVCAVTLGAAQRLPVVTALPVGLASVLAASLLWPTFAGNFAATALGLMVLGYVIRQDRESRATAHRMLLQEREMRAAEAETAALAERGRIAREIHDVLAHSLSAQLVHLEAARLMLDGGAEREQVRERVVAARRMAQEGLEETRRALSALRGDIVPVGDYLAELARTERARLSVEGVARPLAAEVGQSLRRVAQEALTNVRKHAPGASVELTLRYLPAVVELMIANGPARSRASELAASGGGYGLLGMRERAELLGGELRAEPDDAGGFCVRLRVPG